MRQGADRPFSNNLRPPVTLKIGSRSPKSNKFLFMSQQYRCTSLVKIHPFILEIGCRQAIFQQSEPSCDLEKWGQGHQNLISFFFSMSQQYRCTSLVNIHPFSQEIGCRQAIFQPSRQGHQNLINSFTCPSNLDVQVWSKSICSFRRWGADKQFSSLFHKSKSSCDLENGVKVIKILSAFFPHPMINLCKVWPKSIHSLRR